MKFISKLALVGITLGAFASSANALELKMNGLHAPSHPASMTHEFFGDRVAELTGGKITVDVHHARGLGDAVESVQMIRNGTVAFFDVSAANLSQVDKRLDMFTLPYLFKSKAHDNQSQGLNHRRDCFKLELPDIRSCKGICEAA